VNIKNRRFAIPEYPDEYRPDDPSWVRQPKWGRFPVTQLTPEDIYAGSGASAGKGGPAEAVSGGGACRTESPDPDCLSIDEQALTSALRTLATVPHLAVRCFLVRDDLRLARALYDRLFLGSGRGQLIDQAGDDVG
jgi:hypothetical protein